MPSNIVLTARLAESGSTVPGWLIAAKAEEAAAEYLGEAYRDLPVCPTCFTTRARSTGKCFCDD